MVPGLDPEIDEIVIRALEEGPRQALSGRGGARGGARAPALAAGTGGDAVAGARPTPPTRARSGEESGHDSRAEAAYQRSLAVYAEGAHDAARRFAIEALAEDPDHEGALEFMKRFGASTWPPLPQRSQAAVARLHVLRPDGPPDRESSDRHDDGERGTVLEHRHPSVRRGIARPHRLARSLRQGRAGGRARSAAVLLVAGAVGLGFWAWGGSPGRC